MSSHDLKHRILKQEMAAWGTTGRESYGYRPERAREAVDAASPNSIRRLEVQSVEKTESVRTATDTTVGQSLKTMETVGAQIRVFSLSLQIR